MNWLDIVIAIILVISIVGGLMAGVIKILFGVIGLIVGVILAGNYAGPLGDKLTFMSADTAHVVAFIVIMLVVMLIAGLLAFIIKKIAETVLLGWVNRLGGAVLGLALGMILVGAALTMWINYLGYNSAVDGSRLATFLVDKFPIALSILPKEFRSVRDFFN